MSEQISNPATAVPEVFQFHGHEVRTIDKDGEVWFVAKDIAEILGYNKTDSAMKHCKASETCSCKMGEQVRVLTIIPERDMYRLVLKSTLPAAEQFEEWVVSEVLPSIRKHGHYSVSPVQNLPALPTDTRELLFLAVDAIKVVSTEIKQLTERTNQAEDMALEAATGIEEMKATFRLHEWQKFELKEAVNHKVKALRDLAGGLTGSYYSMVWGFVKRHFKVSKYDAIPAIRYEEAKIIITNITMDQLGVTK